MPSNYSERSLTFDAERRLGPAPVVAIQQRHGLPLQVYVTPLVVVASFLCMLWRLVGNN